jgi:hypothetical protein
MIKSKNAKSSAVEVKSQYLSTEFSLKQLWSMRIKVVRAKAIRQQDPERSHKPSLPQLIAIIHLRLAEERAKIVNAYWLHNKMIIRVHDEIGRQSNLAAEVSNLVDKVAILIPGRLIIKINMIHFGFVNEVRA